jgi:hypothetical protein
MYLPRGSSTIHMQVARFLLMKYDNRGYAFTERSIGRKIQELKLAQALEMKYTKEEILMVYVNHCVTAGRGMRGYYDISEKLFGLPPCDLSIAQSLYLSRLVKWNRHVPSKIINQIKINMPALIRNFKWKKELADSIYRSLDSLSFKNSKDVIPRNSHLIDLANEYLREICRMNGMDSSLFSDIDISNPESTIRRYGDLTITLTLDYRLQTFLEKIVKTRGFGSDTLINALSVEGQFYSYAIMDSKTRELLAYYSKDRLGSRLRSLTVNKNPNGSSTAKPLVYALAYDLGIYKPTDMASDNEEVTDTCPWERKILLNSTKPVGMIYQHTTEKAGYKVHNSHYQFDGYDYLFNHLSNSNNIIAVETIYRLNSDLSDSREQQSGKMLSLLNRIGASELISKQRVTGPDVYTAIVSRCIANSLSANERSLHEQRYSIALGTFELTLYDQMHMFNILYDGKLIEKPSKHPRFFIKAVELSGNKVQYSDSIKAIHLFEDFASIHPVHLGLHKRLISNSGDRLDVYDLCDSQEGQSLSNYAKSGTTDDIFKPYNSDNSDISKTNYGLWNAILRLNLTKKDMIRVLTSDSVLNKVDIAKSNTMLIPDDEMIDVTLACIGECNELNTGSRDGKTLHSYVSTALLHEFGIKCTTGFFKKYEKQIVEKTSDKVKYANNVEKSNLSVWSKTMIRLRSGKRSERTEKTIRFEKQNRTSGIRLKGKNFHTIEKIAPYMGSSSKEYIKLINKLKNPESFSEIKAVIDEMKMIEITNQVLKRELDLICEYLIKSADEFRDSGDLKD